jgi:hypothetical protein
MKPKFFRLFLGILISALFFEGIFPVSVYAQRRGTGRRPGTQTPEGSAIPADPLAGAAVPKLWMLTHETDLNAKPFLDRAMVSPVVSAKIARYARRILEKYDADGSGVLEQEEWEKMQGTPQVMDLDSNFLITQEELTAHIVDFGQGRTIHLPYPSRQVTTLAATQPKEETKIFRPLSTPPKSPPSTRTLEGNAFEEDLSLEEINEQISKAETSAAGKTGDSENKEDSESANTEETAPDLPENIPPPAEKRYHTPNNGLPEWFVRRDLNGDGQLSLVEFAPTLSNGAIATFGKLDKNGDAYITQDEIPR